MVITLFIFPRGGLKYKGYYILSSIWDVTHGMLLKYGMLLSNAGCYSMYFFVKINDLDTRIQVNKIDYFSHKPFNVSLLIAYNRKTYC